MTTRKKKTGLISFQRPDKMVKKKWKSYRFEVNAMYFFYCKSDNIHKPDGMVLLGSITKLETNPVKDTTFPLQVHFSGKPVTGNSSSPWVLDLLTNEDRMEWMECLKPGSSKDLLRFSQPSILKQLPDQSLCLSLTSPSTDDDSHQLPEFNITCPSNTGMNDRPTMPQEYLEFVAVDSDANRHAVAPAAPPRPRLRRIAEIHSREQGTGYSTSQDNSFLSKSMDSRPQLNSRKHSPRHTFTHGGHKVESVVNSHQRSNSAYTSRDHQKLSESHRDFHIKDERGPSTSPEPHTYEMDDEMNSLLDMASGKSPMANSRTLLQDRRGMLKGTSCDKEGEFAIDGKEGEFDGRYEVLPKKPVPAARRPANSKPAITPRKKKGTANCTPLQHEYLDLMPENEVLKGDQNYVGSGNETEPFNSMKSLSTDKLLVTDEDDEGSYMPRPSWAKAMGLDVSSRKRQQLSSECEALKDLQADALYISHSSISDLHKIGEGQFGEVFCAVLQRGMANSFTVAVKTSKKSQSEKETTDFLREMSIMSQLRHPNIVQLHGVIQDDVPAPWIVLEYLKNGDLKKFLTKNKKPVESLLKYMVDVAMGMHYLSEKGLVHRDLAARNVLVSEDETCKVSDFGLLRELPEGDSIYHMSTVVPCPVRWMAPESFGDRVFSPASDVWSFGILQWEMFHPTEMPYHHLGNMELVAKVTNGYRLEAPLHCPYVVSRIMKACWHHVPEKRPSFLLITTLLSAKV